MRTAMILAAVLAAAAAAAAWHGHRALHQPLVLAQESYLLQVSTGDTLQGVVRQLAADGVLRHPRQVLWAARLSGLELGIKAGEYALQPGMRADELIGVLAEGRVVMHAFTIIEGWTYGELRAALAEHPALVTTLAGVDDDTLMARLGRPGDHPEGLFFPDTYLFARGTTDIAFLERALRTLEARLEQAWAQRDSGLPYETPYEALIMASIIESEAQVRAERPVIAGVFVRRLQRNMRLQTDPTVVYGLGPGFEGRLRTRHLRADTPYNTYTRHGLPPTPIALPGASALRAALQPADGDALYFVSRGDGSHHFSATLEEHNRAVRRYILGQGDDGRGTER